MAKTKTVEPLGKRILARATIEGLTDIDVAAVLGVDPKTVRRWFDEGKGPVTIAVKRAAEAWLKGGAK